MPYDIELYKERSITPDGFSSSDALDGLFSDSEQTKSDKKVLQEKESLLNTLSKLAIYLYEIQQGLNSDPSVRLLATSDNLPEQDTIRPDIRLDGGDSIKQRLRTHPHHR